MRDHRFLGYATHGERKEMLARFRQQDSAAALELLRKDWKSEPANQRNELLECLRINISKADELFIQEVLESDRSSIVKETARKLLCMIPDSAMVMRCCELLRGHISTTCGTLPDGHTTRSDTPRR